MRKAFTLIELLVVIAIIAILAAILFPVFSQAKAAAKKTAALSNTKQLILSYIMYTGDYDGTYYEHAQGMSVGLQGPTSLIWSGYLYPYTKNVAIATDPATTQPTSPYNGVNFTGMYFQPVDYKQLSIGYNQVFTSQFDYACSIDFSAGTPNCLVFFNENIFPSPSTQLVFANTTYRTPAAPTGQGFWASPDHNIDADNGISDVHNGFTVTSEMDGHAKAVKSTSLLVSDMIIELNPNADGQCVNYNAAGLMWDPTAPYPATQPLCEGYGVR